MQQNNEINVGQGPKPDTPHTDPAAQALARLKCLVDAGKQYESIDIRDARLPGLTINQDVSLKVWLTPRLIKAFENSSARLEIILSTADLAPTLVLDEFRGFIRAGFRSGNAAMVLGHLRAFNMRTLFYDRAFMSIGDKSSCNSASATLSDASILIGEDCMLSHDIQLQPSDQHDIIEIETGAVINRKRSIILEDHVWIGKEAYLGAGSKIGSGAIVGARAVVIGAVAPNTVVAGNPAREVRAGVTWKREFNAVTTTGEVSQP